MKKICIGIDVSKETLDVTVIHIESYDWWRSWGIVSLTTDHQALGV